jgi:hypothetical protein
MNHDTHAATILDGSRVRLFPRSDRKDGADAVLEGRAARVEAVLRDVTGRSYVAVFVEDAAARGVVLPALLLLRADEVQLISEVASGSAPTRSGGTEISAGPLV